MATGSVTVEGNYCGTDATGNVAIGNARYPGNLATWPSTRRRYRPSSANNLVSGNGPGIILSSNAVDHHSAGVASPGVVHGQR